MKRAKPPTEDKEQEALVAWADSMFLNDPRFPKSTKIGAFLFAVPNGQLRTARIGAALKRQGVRAGVPDLWFVYPRGNCPGLVIEMKRRAGATVSPLQHEWIEKLGLVGHRVEVCYGWDQARDVLMDYLGLT